MSVADAVRYVNVMLASWLLVWAIVVFRTRIRQGDLLGGQWLAVSWFGLLLAVVVGNIYGVQHGLQLTPGSPIVTIALSFGLVAQYTAIRRSRTRPPTEEPE